MTRFIRVGSTDAELIEVRDVYAYIYESEKGKTVLRLSIPETSKSFTELKDLLTNGETIYAYEQVETAVENVDGESEVVTEYKLIGEHTNYAKDYKCDYSAEKGEYFIEITRKSDLEILTEENTNDTLTAYEAIAAMYEDNL